MTGFERKLSDEFSCSGRKVRELMELHTVFGAISGCGFGVSTGQEWSGVWVCVCAYFFLTFYEANKVTIFMKRKNFSVSLVMLETKRPAENV